MLVSFTFENWRSFRDANTLNLVATDEEEHRGRIPENKDHNFHLLPIVAIYGGNASGKSNFFKALYFARQMVTEGPSVSGNISLDSFRPDGLHKPSRFGFVILIKDKDGREQGYDYGFTLSREKVIEEKLIWIQKSSEIVLFERQDGREHIFYETIEKDSALRGTLDNTRNNQLFLTNVASQNTSKYGNEQILDVFRWFERLMPIQNFDTFPSTFLKEEVAFNRTLSMLGTGVVKLVLQRVPWSDIPLSQGDIEGIKSQFGSFGQKGVSMMKKGFGKPFHVSVHNNELVAQRLFSVHRGSDSQSEVLFDLNDESDGTVRLIDLLTHFLAASKQDNENVFVIDELDRSLHTQLLRQLLESYLASCSPKSRSQIIFTTHDVLQMDEGLLRRDEMWVTDRKKDGSTELIPLSSYKGIRDDKSIRTSYLRGHFRGTPKLLLSGAFPLDEEEHQ